VPNVTSHPHIISVKDLTCTKLRWIVQPLKMFKLDNGVYPSTKEGLEALLRNLDPNKYKNYSPSAYMEKLPLDGWRKPFIYNYYRIDKGNNFEIISFGADGKYGGEGENEDIIYPPIKSSHPCREWY
jgi:general secretion pathway protein G